MFKKFKKKSNSLTENQKSDFETLISEALTSIPVVGQAVNFIDSCIQWRIDNPKNVVKKIMNVSQPSGIDDVQLAFIAYAIENILKTPEIPISEYVSVKKEKFTEDILKKYNEKRLEYDYSDSIQEYIKQIANIILNNIVLIEPISTTTITTLKTTSAHDDQIKELSEEVRTHGKDIKKIKVILDESCHDNENSGNDVLKDSENQEGCSAEEEKKTDDAPSGQTSINNETEAKRIPDTPKLMYLILSLILLSLLLGGFKYCSHQSSNKSNKQITSTTTNTKVSTTTEPIITTETVTTTQKETETQSTVIQTSTTISNHTTNEVALTENTSLEQTTLPPIETTTVVTEQPSNSNEELKFICEEYHIDAIEDFCEDMSGVIITEYKGTPPEHLIIPAQIDDVNVIAIDEAVFSGKDNIKSLVIPDTVYEIKARAFMNCSYLSNIYLGKNVLKIGDYAFFCFQFNSNEERILTVSNPKFQEEAAFRGDQWNGRNNDYRIDCAF